ncbi:UPF0481 protein At3g47200-like [Alnus glutinosa]|uniref:UPF0481 protein At3g47200-like n=1 Tax=Alnus glutinosa TaxID=3517 RepID=UPI002D78EEBF|nr:UPF0481 protein At3g47200-like [Alnus glutinosa]
MEMSHLIDIADPHVPLVDSMGKELQSLKLSPFSAECIIYKVPERLHHVKERAYTPKVVSIGPLHHGIDESLIAMQEHKMRYLGDFIERTGKTLEFFLDFVRKNEAKLRGCYAETIHLCSDQFVKMILVDAAFIVEVLLKSSNPKMQLKNDRIFKKPWLIQDVWTDMLLLENQLPFFILKDLFEAYSREVPSENLTLVRLTENFFKSRMESPGIEDRWEEFSCGDFEIKHFVDLLRHVRLKPSKRDEMKLWKLTMPTMTELHQAGVTFQVSRSRNLFDIKFDKKKGILEIPSFIFSTETELTIRNSLAFEQCHYNDENYINDYVIIMNRLVETRMDIELLVKERIVENRFSNTREGSNFLNKLADGATLDQNNFYFASLSEELNAYYKTPWHKWKANLRQKYFKTPWTVISLVAAIFLFILTFIQTVYSVK